jgi:hypothetical protein
MRFKTLSICVRANGSNERNYLQINILITNYDLTFSSIGRYVGGGIL